MATELSGLLPLLPPPPPPTTSWSVWLAIAGGCMLILGLRWWWQSPSTQRAKRFRHLQKALERPQPDTRELATQLNQWLCLCLSEEALKNPQGKHLTNRLQQARYAAKPQTVAELNQLLTHAQHYVRDHRD